MKARSMTDGSRRSTNRRKQVLTPMCIHLYTVGMTLLTDMSRWDDPVLPIEVAAQAALTEIGTLRMWWVRKRIPLSAHGYTATAEPEKSGLPRFFSFRTVLTLAAAAPLVKRGVKIEDAYLAAASWTHFGQGWDGNGPCPREPACLFADPAWTFLIHRSGNEGRVIEISPDSGALAFPFADLFGYGGPSSPAPAVVFLNKVDQYARGVCDGWLRHEANPAWHEAARAVVEVDRLASDPEGSTG
jgi:hypothetical protein